VSSIDHPAAGAGGKKRSTSSGRGAGALMGKESDEEASLSASFHLFFFISKLTSTRERRGGNRPLANQIIFLFSLIFKKIIKEKGLFSCARTSAGHICYIPAFIAKPRKMIKKISARWWVRGGDDGDPLALSIFFREIN